MKRIFTISVAAVMALLMVLSLTACGNSTLGYYKLTSAEASGMSFDSSTLAAVGMVKDTSLSSVIAIPEILMRAKDFSMQGLIWPLFYSAVFFLAFCGILTLLFSFIEKKLDYYKG